MNEKIKLFIDDLRKHLVGLPENEILEAISYYEEYLNDSKDAGKDIDEVLMELDSPEKIGASLKKEANLSRAENHPGIRNFSMAVKAAFKGISKPLTVFSLSITAFISFCIIALIFSSSVSFGIGGALVILLCIYQAFTISSHFFLEILGTLGAGLLLGGILSIAALYFWRCGKFFISLSAKQIRLILHTSGKTETKSQNKESKRLWPSVRLILIISVVGLILFGISGLPWRFFTITNSMKPESNINKVVLEYDPRIINKISAVTAHSSIKIEEGASDKIVVSYEEPDWLTHEAGDTGGTLYFQEKSNGRLPFFSLISIHGSQTQLTISLPRGLNIDALILQSTGGNIYISDINRNIDAKTLTGSIQFTQKNSKTSITAQTGSGHLTIYGNEITKRVNGQKIYKNDASSQTKVTLRSTSGSISVLK